MPSQLIDARHWPNTVLTPITVANYIITVPDTYGIRVKQIATLSKPGETTKQYEVRRVLSATQLQVGELDNKDFRSYANPINFTGGTLAILEQERNKMGPEIYGRATYEEDPVIAWRALLVDPYGTRIDSVLDDSGLTRLAVDSTVTLETLSVDIDYPNTPTIFSISMAANTEQTFALPANTSRFLVKSRDSESPWRLAFVLGDTASNYISMNAGSVYWSQEVDLPAQNLYVLAKKASVIEIHTWRRI